MASVGDELMGINETYLRGCVCFIDGLTIKSKPYLPHRQPLSGQTEKL